MTHKNNGDSVEDDVIFEPEQESNSSFSKGDESAQIKKLKKKLKEAQEKAKENLDGWQRLRADTANNKKTETERINKAKERGAEEILESLLPALDSFDSAMQAESWANIDDAWRRGMEFVHDQLIMALEQHGIVAFGAEGDTFDTTKYDAAEGEGTEVQKVLRKGYKKRDKVIRPARVIV